MKDITELRAEIDAVDSQIIELFRQRMEISEGVAAYKQAVGKPIYDPERERQKLVKIAKEADPDLRTGAIMLFSTGSRPYSHRPFSMALNTSSKLGK